VQFGEISAVASNEAIDAMRLLQRLERHVYDVGIGCLLRVSRVISVCACFPCSCGEIGATLKRSSRVAEPALRIIVNSIQNDSDVTESTLIHAADEQSQC